MAVDFKHYSPQQNIYKFIIENFYTPITVNNVIYNKIEVEEMFLVIMHSNRNSYNKLKVPNYQSLVPEMFDQRKQQLQKV